ncbi:hypothetical protein AAVH_30827 [Aphelenchoides avenae]|nr:hypothetical protein AAVH_30826 [Aphelenchus avenae]KAH7702032.1 hypothetical protein AAVH_30827 [Aphelenchus avenae]
MNRLIGALIVGLLLFGLNEGSGNASWTRFGTEMADANTCWYNVVDDCWCCNTDAHKASCNEFCIRSQGARWGTCGYNDKLKQECCVCFPN